MKRWLSLVLLALCLSPARATELDRAAQARIGLRLAAIRPVEMPAREEATASVLDPAPLARQFGQLATAQAAADAATAELRRTRALVAADGNASRRSLEQAQARLAAARATRDEAEAALRTGPAAPLAAMPAEARQRLMQAVIAGRSVLLAAEPLAVPRAGFRPRSARVEVAGSGVDARVLGPLPQSVSGLAPGWLLQIDAPGLVPGMATTAQLAGAPDALQGLVVPAAAIVRWNGLDWVYVATGPTRFERRAVHARAIDPRGWLVGPPFRAGDRVVVRGAEALLAVDAAPVPTAAAPADEDDD